MMDHKSGVIARIIDSMMVKESVNTFLDPTDLSYKSVGTLKDDVLAEIAGDKLSGINHGDNGCTDMMVSFDMLEDGISPDGIVKVIIKDMIADNFTKINEIKLYIRTCPSDDDESGNIVAFRCRIKGLLA